MLVIRTAEELAYALDSPLETKLRTRLDARSKTLCDYLDEYALEELAIFIIAQPGDTLGDLNKVSPLRLVEGNRFVLEVETASQHDGWLELTFILSDDGSGLVLFVPTNPYPGADWRTACEAIGAAMQDPTSR
ncbi:hypothetical protein P7228_09035 [Altererythrobacter arenosus]|uniref:Uncharacterized protein n=1 Tax=Altererythrobacter arenosus TaxID=3032592 RepID=A0ABY8FSV4_9SPHN|nr:hypothetical protein [Altererythrobacter sp. CAU 1644]WFL76146.1 hypothetical protein P7228_09035 [Altererythrobacter sp. CAU 1644]